MPIYEYKCNQCGEDFEIVTVENVLKSFVQLRKQMHLFYVKFAKAVRP
jgi:predicted nucleic acid-binding Zn ribbon protein